MVTKRCANERCPRFGDLARRNVPSRAHQAHRSRLGPWVGSLRIGGFPRGHQHLYERSCRYQSLWRISRRHAKQSLVQSIGDCRLRGRRQFLGHTRSCLGKYDEWSWARRRLRLYKLCNGRGRQCHGERFIEIQ